MMRSSGTMLTKEKPSESDKKTCMGRS